MADQNTDNQTQVNGTEDNNSSDITNIMGGMAGDAKPEVKPDNGENTEGKEKPEDKTELPKWTDQLTDELRSNPDVMKQLSKFAKIGDLAKSYSELETKLGKSLVKPGEDASEEEINAFYQKLGMPESADGYSISNENKAFKELAYKNRLTDNQAKGMLEALKTIGNQVIEQQKAAFNNQAQATTKALKAEYGNDYDAKIKLLTKGVETYGGKALGEKLRQTGLLADLDVVKMFITLGEQVSEAGTQTKNSNAKGYKSISEGGFLSFGKDFD